MRDDRNNNSIVSGPERWSWPWRPAQDVSVGSRIRQANSSVEAAEPIRLPGFKASSLPRTQPQPKSHPKSQTQSQTQGPQAVTARPAGLTGLLTTAVIMAAFVFHAVPHVTRMGGEVGMGDSRGLLVFLADFIPVVLDFDAARWLVPAASAWLWQPLIAGIGAGVLRLVALNSASRAPVAAVWIAAMALLVDTATWLFIGLRLWGSAYSPEEGAALVTVLQVEGGVLLALLFLLGGLRKKRSGTVEAG